MRQVAKCECARWPNSLRPNTGTLITEKYSSFYSEKHKNNLNDKSLEQKVEK